jgi:FkbM family methyltransferase
MRVHDRDVRRILAAPFAPRHWRALWFLFRIHEQPLRALARYLTNRGDYPWQPGLRTPLGVVRPVLTSYHDLLTVNEVFCRHDYGDGEGVRTVVDVGANVGLAALFFLTRSPDVRVWCCEPDPANLDRLRETLRPYLDRVTVVPKAVTAEPVDSVRFAPQGRYGHIDDAGPLEVEAVSLAELLRSVERHASPIDLVKIDTEGTELELLRSAPADLPVRAFVYEDEHGRTRWASVGAAR